MAARKGLGVLGFSVGSLEELEPVMTAYKKEIANAEPVGAFVNDNIMVTTRRVRGRGPTSEAVQPACQPSMPYLQSNVFRYHDTFPRPDRIPAWPELIPDHRRGDRVPYMRWARGRSSATRTTRSSSAGAGRRPAPTSWCSASAWPPEAETSR